jgi:hypothetical protein
MTKKKTNAGTEPDLEDQAPEKLKRIRALRRDVKRCELAYGMAKEDAKFRREELDGAVQKLCQEIDGSAQGELYVAHLDAETGELEDGDTHGDKHDDIEVTLEAGGRSATTSLGGLKRAAKNAGRVANAVANARGASED